MYGRLALMLALTAIAMYALMYAMVDVIGNAVPNLNQLYMALLMTGPMLLLELWIMRRMYPSRTLNAVFAVLGVALIAVPLFLIRTQAGIGDAQLLRSMIPHHAGAVLMCEEATLADPQVELLCQNILMTQRAELDWMRLKLDSLEQAP